MKVVGAEGFEPDVENTELVENQPHKQLEKTSHTQGHAHAVGAVCPGLAKVVAGWSKLPAPLKAAILAIINSVEVGS